MDIIETLAYFVVLARNETLGQLAAITLPPAAYQAVKAETDRRAALYGAGYAQTVRTGSSGIVVPPNANDPATGQPGIMVDGMWVRSA